MVEKTVEQTGPIRATKYHFLQGELERLLSTPGASRAFEQVGGILMANEAAFEQAISDAGMTIQLITEESPTEESTASPVPARRKLPRSRTS